MINYAKGFYPPQPFLSHVTVAAAHLTNHLYKAIVHLIYNMSILQVDTPYLYGGCPESKTSSVVVVKRVKLALKFWCKTPLRLSMFRGDSSRYGSFKFVLFSCEEHSIIRISLVNK